MGTTVHANPYAYGRNDPLDLVDPLGLSPTTDGSFRSDWVIVDDVRTGGCGGCSASQYADEPPTEAFGGGGWQGIVGWRAHWNAKAFADASLGAAGGFHIDSRVVYAQIVMESADWSSNQRINQAQQTYHQGTFGPINISRPVIDEWSKETWFRDWVIHAWGGSGAYLREVFAVGDITDPVQALDRPVPDGEP